MWLRKFTIFYILKIVLEKFKGSQMKFKNIVFGFLKTWLLIALFYSGSLYAGSQMFIILQDYSHTADEFRPYIFEKDPNTGNLIKVFDTENNFQFKTYSLDSEADMALFEIEVKPTLLEWTEEVTPFQYQSSMSSSLSKDMLVDVEVDLSTGSLSKEIHIATYKGNIESVSYASSVEAERPEITILTANPKGLTIGQTTYPKGGGSALLNYELQRYKAGDVEKVRLYSVEDEYYLSRGWKTEPEFDVNFDFNPDSSSSSDSDPDPDFDPDFDFNNEGACGWN